ncbi:MAG: hypothetical protein FWD55_02460 [Propionibacteriaceae bacterium]|nr:hypothetical protein [Propionibacteriaceae bacterium]
MNDADPHDLIQEYDSSGDLGSAAMYCEDLAHALLEQGNLNGAEEAFREGVCNLFALGDFHSFDGFIEGTTLRLYAGLARLLVPSPEALGVAEEFVEAIRAGRNHPMDMAEALTLRAEVFIACGGIDQAIQASTDAVKQSESVCFHELSRQVEQALCDRLDGEGRHEEAMQWKERAIHRLDDKVPGHIHLWDQLWTMDGTTVLIPEGEGHGPPPYTPGSQPGAAI